MQSLYIGKLNYLVAGVVVFVWLPGFVVFLGKLNYVVAGFVIVTYMHVATTSSMTIDNLN